MSKPHKSKIGIFFFLLVIIVLVAIAFTELYTAFNLSLSDSKVKRGWLGAACVNILFAVVVLCLSARRKTISLLRDMLPLVVASPVKNWVGSKTWMLHKLMK